MDYLQGYTLISVTALSVGIAAFFIARFILRSEDRTNRILNMQERSFARRQRISDAIFLTMFVVVTISILVQVNLLYATLRNGGKDLALFDQVVWNSLHGRLFETTLLPDNITSQLGIHFSIILLALVPLYALVGDPIVLRTVQTFSIVGIAFPLYWFARARIGYTLALVIAFAFLLSPILPAINGYDFHETPLATTPLAFALYFVLRRRDAPFLACVAIALLVKEDISLIVSSLGLYALFVQRRIKLGLGLIGVGAAWVVTVVQVVMPRFTPAGMWLGRLYPELGSSFGEMLLTIVTRPMFFLQYVLMPEKIAFVLHLIAPLVFVPFLGMEITALIAAPLMESLLGGIEIMYRPFTWYPASMLPFVFFGAVIGVQRILTIGISQTVSVSECARIQFARQIAVLTLLVVATLLNYYLYSSLPFSKDFDLAAILPNAHTDLGNTLLRAIPADAAVAVPDDVMPHLSHRNPLYTFPAFPDYRRVDYLFVDTTRFWYNFHRDSWADVLGTGYFEILSNQDGYILAKRKSLEHPSQIRFDDQIALLGYTVPLTGTIQGGQILRPITGWRAEQNIVKPYIVSVRLLDQAGHIWAQDEREPQEGNLPTTRWMPNQFVGDQYALSLPVMMPPGDYQIVIAVFDPESNRNLIARDTTGRALGETVVLDTVRIEKNRANITASDLQKQFQLENPFFVDMQEIRLIGFKSLPQTIAGGNNLPVGIYWRAREKPRGDYFVTAQLFDAMGRVVVEEKNRPAAGAYPTMQWVEGEVLLDWHDLAVPALLVPGEYTVQVTLSDAIGKVLGQAVLEKISVVGR